MIHSDKGRLSLNLTSGPSAASGIANGIALSVGLWCTVASILLLVR